MKKELAAVKDKNFAKNFAKNYEGKVVLIVGASSGIGEALAIELAAQGASLVLAARRVENLKRVALACERNQVRALIMPCDVSRDGEVRKSVEAALQTFGRLDIVFANAGFGVSSHFEKLKLEDYRRQFETNVFGVLRTAYDSLKALKSSQGQFVITGSVAGYVALPGASPYAMSKFAVRAFAEALRAELKPEGVDVTLISPGFVDSEIRKVDNQGALHEHAKDPIPSWIRVSSEKAAREILAAVAVRKKEQIVTGHGKIIVKIQRFCPWFVDWVIGRGLKGRPEPKEPK